MLDLIIVDDDKSLKPTFDRIFKDSGLSYALYHCPHDGMEAIISQRPKVVLIDYLIRDLKADEIIIRASELCAFQYSSFALISCRDHDAFEKMQFMTLGFEYVFPKGEIEDSHFLDHVRTMLNEKQISLNKKKAA